MHQEALVEGKHASDRIEARAWARETEANFGVGQQLTADTGTQPFPSIETSLIDPSKPGRVID